MSELEVRDAVLGDAEAISTVLVRSWQAAYRGILPGDFLGALQDDSWAERWRGHLAADDVGHRLVSTSDGEVVAVAAAGPEIEEPEAGSAVLRVLYTHPAHWGAGHGSALLSEVHRRLSEDGHRQAQLWVARANVDAIGFYERHGWARDGARRVEDVHGATMDVVRMVRSLP